MNKGILILGVIIIIIGIGLMVYNEENILSSEYKYGLDRQTVPLEEVDSMVAQGWEEVLTYEEWVSDTTRGWEPPATPEELESLKEEWDEFVASKGGVLMVKEGRYLEEYYVVEYPYQIVGAIVTLIGSVTSIISITISDSRIKSR